MKSILMIAIMSAALAAPLAANAAPRHYYSHGGAGTAAAAHFQDQFKNTY